MIYSLTILTLVLNWLQLTSSQFEFKKNHTEFEFQELIEAL